VRTFIILQLFNFIAFANTVNENSFPIFLKMGFSSIIDFSEMPIRIVLGDSQSFQIEKMDKSLVLRTLVSYSTTNMFVYFKDAPPQIFTLTADEDANPTIYRKFEVIHTAKTVEQKSVLKNSKISKLKRGSFLTEAFWNKEKDYLTIDGFINADSDSILLPKWDLVRLAEGEKRISPFKVWSARKDIQKDSSVKFRFIFLRPNVDKDLKKNIVIIPLQGKSESLHLELKKGK
jgi:hypothetical protein